MIGSNTSIWSFVIHASVVVQFVMAILLVASLLSWTLIFQRTSLLKNSQRQLRRFQQQFNQATDIKALFDRLDNKLSRISGSAAIFHAGMQEFLTSSELTRMSNSAKMENCERAMRVAAQQQISHLESHLSFLATVGSTSPYIGLFGTVWGIMTSFQALGSVQQASIAMVAPGISEALVATAIGLFAAIPAVIAYNRFSNKLEQLQEQYAAFQESFINILHRETYTTDEQSI